MTHIFNSKSSIRNIRNSKIFFNNPLEHHKQQKENWLLISYIEHVNGTLGTCDGCAGSWGKCNNTQWAFEQLCVIRGTHNDRKQSSVCEGVCLGYMSKWLGNTFESVRLSYILGRLTIWFEENLSIKISTCSTTISCATA